MKIEVLGDEKTIVAFSLAGIPGKIVNSRNEALEIVKNSKEVAVFFIVDEFFPTGYSEDFPILVRIPRRE